ncbi:MAG: MraY family glycosyltransferase [Cyanobacteria bacterium J06634_6]
MFFSLASYDSALAESLLLAASCALALSLWLTPVVRIKTLQCGKTDLPSGRKVHQMPMARTGGIAICVATVLSSSLAFCLLSSLNDLSAKGTASFWILILGSSTFFCVGLADDLITLSPLLRLLLQGAIACAMWMIGLRIETLSLPVADTVELGWLSLPVTTVWIVGVINAINWTDGLDGLAAGTGVMAAVASFAICLSAGQFSLAIVCLALLGSLSGFLFFNFNPAQIFMGDGGSYFIGAVLASVSIAGFSHQTMTVPALLPLLILAVPLLDMLCVIVTRIYRGVSPFSADNRHLHHRLMQAGLSHRLTVLSIYALACWSGSVAVVMAGIPGCFLTVTSATGVLCFMGCKARYALLRNPLPN